MNKLTGKVAIVTGASKGIGAAIASGLAKAGASVIVNYASSKAGADAVVEAIVAEGGKALAVHGNVADPQDMRGLVDAALLQFGRLDIVVNNAGIWDIVQIADITAEQFRHSFDTNVLGPMMLTREALPHMSEGASIINISSNATTLHPPGSTLYTATKSALEGMTSVLAKELGPRKIRINAILPGMVDTEGNRSKGFVGSDIERFAVSQTPLGRIGQPQDIADVAVFLASDDARWLTGERLIASGGFR
jgi:3-oxoacyl-[acyl-carrier protein] reductase